jgi:condensin complex subunit 3
VSPASTEEKLREVYDEVSVAVDDKLISDATGRNALYKIHVSLGKIVNSLTEKTSRSRKSSAVVEDKTVLVDEGIEESAVEKTELVKVEEEDEGTVLADETRVGRDSLVEELLSDEDVDMSGV